MINFIIKSFLRILAILFLCSILYIIIGLIFLLFKFFTISFGFALIFGSLLYLVYYIDNNVISNKNNEDD
jgi:hypothetical protein